MYKFRTIPANEGIFIKTRDKNKTGIETLFLNKIYMDFTMGKLTGL